MSKGRLGCFSGAVTAGENMVEVFRKKEMDLNENTSLSFMPFMTLKKLGIQCNPGTVVEINGCPITIFTGVFELGFGQIDVTSIVFQNAGNANIYYMY